MELGVDFQGLVTWASKVFKHLPSESPFPNTALPSHSAARRKQRPDSTSPGVFEAVGVAVVLGSMGILLVWSEYQNVFSTP